MKKACCHGNFFQIQMKKNEYLLLVQHRKLSETNKKSEIHTKNRNGHIQKHYTSPTKLIQLLRQEKRKFTNEFEWCTNANETKKIQCKNCILKQMKIKYLRI